MAEVEGGNFMMGNESGMNFEKPLHEVLVPDFEIGCFPVTNELFSKVLGTVGLEIPLHLQGPPRLPIKQVTWDIVQLFLQLLNTFPEIQSCNNRDGRIFRLPSESQWEYAARGGKRSQFFPFAGSYRLNEVGWSKENSYASPKAVGMKLPNELGLYDMSGNVWELCEDHWHKSYIGAPRDGSAWIDLEKNIKRVVRGGAWFTIADGCRISIRYEMVNFVRAPGTGFRLARY